jgi:hypothetical protein
LLFVASSNNNVGKVSYWDSSSIFKEPFAKAYLPGKVQSARQKGGVVLALGLSPD